MGEHRRRWDRGGLFVIGLALQFGTRRYRAIAYWFLAYAIAIFGTGVSDFLHLDVGIPYAGTTLLWAVVLAAIFVVWYHLEGTLSIHSITTRRRECFYWATVFATFALGTALGDFTATALGLGYLASGILFGMVILIPAVAWWQLGLNERGGLLVAYVVTRPLGASFADYISKRRAHQWDRIRRRTDRGRVHRGRRGPRPLPRHRSPRHSAGRDRGDPIGSHASRGCEHDVDDGSAAGGVRRQFGGDGRSTYHRGGCRGLPRVAFGARRCCRGRRAPGGPCGRR